MAWFDIAGGRVRFRGRVTKHPIAAWMNSGEGSEAVQAAAGAIRFSLFGRTGAARRKMHRDLYEALTTSGVRAALTAESDRYLTTWTELAYAPSLPRTTIGVQRLVVVPRAMIVERALPRLRTRLEPCLAGAAMPDTFKAFVSRWILCEMDAAIQRAAPSPRSPVHARESWACVGIDSGFTWVDPTWSGPEWVGHVLMFEMPPGGLPRRERRELETTIDKFKQSLPYLSREQRDGTVRLALDQMRTVRI